MFEAFVGRSLHDSSAAQKIALDSISTPWASALRCTGVWNRRREERWRRRNKGMRKVEKKSGGETRQSHEGWALGKALNPWMNWSNGSADRVEEWMVCGGSFCSHRSLRRGRVSFFFPSLPFSLFIPPLVWAWSLRARVLPLPMPLGSPLIMS